MLAVESYIRQSTDWPRAGRHIIAQYDQDAVIVYQAFCPAIANEALSLQRFGASFSRSRMSWIKPNFLWMMYRCGWATKAGQERVLAVRIRRSFFENLLMRAVWSSYTPELYSNADEWSRSLAASEVRLQWDPDHAPNGSPLRRRAIQLGLRGRALSEYAEAVVLSVTDITSFVEEQRDHARPPYAGLMVPVERVFVPVAAAAIANTRIDRVPNPE